MPAHAKRKVRFRHRSRRLSGPGLWAPICGEDPRVMHHFVPVETRELLQFQETVYSFYLRTFRETP